jgi:hypothetical protein
MLIFMASPMAVVPGLWLFDMVPWLSETVLVLRDR